MDTCPWCGKPVVVDSITLSRCEQANTKRKRRKPWYQPDDRDDRDRYEFSARQQFDSEAVAALPAGNLAPGTRHTAEAYQRWSMSEVLVFLAVAGITALVLIIAIYTTIGATRWAWMRGMAWACWIGFIAWIFGVYRIYDDAFSIAFRKVSESITDAYEHATDSAPPEIRLEVVEVDAQGTPTGHSDWAHLVAPASNHDGLWQYCKALAEDRAYPSMDGAKRGNPGARTYGFSPDEFEAFRHACLTAGLLESKGTSQGYRVTGNGKVSFTRIGMRHQREASLAVGRIDQLVQGAKQRVRRLTGSMEVEIEMAWVKVRKRPVVVKALPWQGGLPPREDFTEEEWRACQFQTGEDEQGPFLSMWTREGDRIARTGYVIIQGTEGEIYPIAPTVFDAVYEPAG